MARDPQAALVALNRFVFGARGGSWGDFVNADSDPRGFVKAELNRTNGVLLEGSGLLPTAALGQAMFAYRAEVKQARAAAKNAASMPMSEGDPPQSANETPKETSKQTSKDDSKPATRNLSMNMAAAEPAPPTIAMNGAPGDGANAAITVPADVAKPPANPPQPLNVIQKTFRNEALARIQRATIADCGFVERLVVFW
jgi:uncharacterized protein (DUF1800 family)